MQGIFINGKRPASKKAVKDAVAGLFNTNVLLGDGAPRVRLEATSMFGNEYDGPIENAPDGTYFFVGPDPYTKRNFYGQVIVKAGVVKVK